MFEVLIRFKFPFELRDILGTESDSSAPVPSYGFFSILKDNKCWDNVNPEFLPERVGFVTYVHLSSLEAFRGHMLKFWEKTYAEGATFSVKYGEDG